MGLWPCTVGGQLPTHCMVNRQNDTQTNTTEYITFPTLRWRSVKISELSTMDEICKYQKKKFCRQNSSELYETFKAYLKFELFYRQNFSPTNHTCSNRDCVMILQVCNSRCATSGVPLMLKNALFGL